MPIQSFEIGTTYAGRANVETLSTTPNMAPRSEFFAYGETQQTAARNYVTRGPAFAVWHWDGFLPNDLYTALRAICPDTAGSKAVVIRTLKDDQATYAYYSAEMVWPPLDSYEPRDKKRVGFVVRFENLVAYTPPS